jgi:hypothetical protein
MCASALTSPSLAERLWIAVLKRAKAAASPMPSSGNSVGNPCIHHLDRNDPAALAGLGLNRLIETRANIHHASFSLMLLLAGVSG